MVNKVHIHRLISTIGGLGYIPYAPGTAGSLVGLALSFLIKGNLISYFLVIIISFFFGVISSGKFEKHSGMKDPSCVIIDEFVGMIVVFFMIPMTFVSMLAGFLIFRFLDIFKPFPIRSLEKFNGGWGIMLDDLIAGILANIFLRVIFGSVGY